MAKAALLCLEISVKARSPLDLRTAMEGFRRVGVPIFSIEKFEDSFVTGSLCNAFPFYVTLFRSFYYLPYLSEDFPYTSVSRCKRPDKKGIFHFPFLSVSHPGHVSTSQVKIQVKTIPGPLGNTTYKCQFNHSRYIHNGAASSNSPSRSRLHPAQKYLGRLGAAAGHAPAAASQHSRPRFARMPAGPPARFARLCTSP